jgi:nicotinate-nucleotide adenylyltransferase
MRLGIYGGTFDPVHYGHLLAAEQFREQCRLERVWFMPAAVPPHKRGAAISPAKARVEMLELAAAGYPQFEISRRELERDGPSYTVDTLSALRTEDPSRELFFLIGADSLDELPTWREPLRILELATIAVANRGDDLPALGTVSTALGTAVRERIVVVEMPSVDLASTDIRRRVQAGRSIRYMVPRAVEEYIRQHRLYVDA